jgi:hypothetical protein
MEQLMGNETIAGLQKEALSDPGMKAAVEQVLKNPEMLNEFKNLFKGGGKWKKRRTRRRRGANGDSDEERARRNASSDEELDALVFHDMSFEEYANAKVVVKDLKRMLSKFNADLKSGINEENNEIMIKSFIKNIEEYESKMRGMMPGKQEEFELYLKYGEPKKRTEEFKENYKAPAIYGGKRRRSSRRKRKRKKTKRKRRRKKKRRTRRRRR